MAKASTDRDKTPTRRGARPEVPPAYGEARALRGYGFQYKFIGEEVERALRVGDVDWVYLGDPRAGGVDDFQIARSDTAEVRAYSVKSSRPAKPLSFQKLVSGGTKSLLYQLADGWTRLKALYPTHRVVVALVTTDYPSPTDAILPKRGSSAGSFAVFLENAWQPVADRAIDEPPAEWRVAWKRAQDVTGLDINGFREFVRSCELRLGHRSLELRQDASREETHRFHDVVEARQILADARSDIGERGLRLDRAQLIALLGWQRRMTETNLHVLHVDEDYRPLPSVNKLQAALKQLPCGYIGVFGPPGCGKSTLLAQELQSERTLRVAHYYAYLPSRRDAPGSRGEVSNFLHDVVLALDRIGLRSELTVATYDEDINARTLTSQLARASEEYRRDGLRTVLVVDGLDHVSRDEAVRQPFLGALPNPDALEQGVYIVVGSQTDQPLKAEIRSETAQVDRRIDMTEERLARDEIDNLARKLLPHGLDNTLLSEINRISMGHPLTLWYVLNALRDVAPEDLMSTLTALPPYDGNMRRQYATYWVDVENDIELVELLGMMARVRIPLELAWIELQFGVGPARRLGRLRHLFRRTGGRLWRFFHESFRLYVKEMTATQPGDTGPDEQAELRINRRIADIFERQPSDSRYAWETLYHRNAAGDLSQVLKIASYERAREQLRSLRPARGVMLDAWLAARAAAQLDDTAGFICQGLIATSADVARQQYDAADVVHTLFRIGEDALALDIAMDPAVVDQNHDYTGSTRLSLAHELARHGYTREGADLYWEAPPRDVIGGKNDWAYHPPWLRPWAVATAELRGARSVLEIADAVLERGYAKRTPEEQGDSAASYAGAIVGCAAAASARSRAWERFSELDDWIWRTPRMLSTSYIDSYGKSLEWLCEDNPEAAKSRSRNLMKVRYDKAGAHVAITSASCFIRIFGDIAAARRVLNSAPSPEMDRTQIDHTEFLRDVFTYERLRRELELPDTLKEPSDDQVRKAYLRVRALAAAVARRADAEIMDAVEDSLTYSMHVHDVRMQYMVSKLSYCVLELAMQAAATLSGAALRRFSIRMQKETSNESWSVSKRRLFVTGLARAGLSDSWLASELQTIETSMLRSEDAAGRVAQCEEQIDAWLTLAKPLDAFRILKMIPSISGGVGFKDDYSPISLLQLADRADCADGDHIVRRLVAFAGPIVAMDSQTEGKVTWRSANAFLRAVARRRPLLALDAFRWFASHRALHWDTALAKLLEAVPHEATALAERDLLVEVLMPVSRTAEPDLFARVKAGLPSEDRAELEQSLDCRLLSSNRKEWRGFVGHNPVLLLQEGTRLTQGEVRTAVTAGKLSELLAREHRDSDFPWETIIPYVQASVDINALCDWACQRPRSFEYFAPLSRRLFQLGESALALKLAGSALQEQRLSEYGGWFYAHDKKLDAFAVIVGLDMDARKECLAELADDLFSKSPYGFVGSVQAIVDAFDPTLDPRAVWDIVVPYVNDLFATLTGPADSLGVRPDDDASFGLQARAELLVWLSSVGYTAIEDGVRRIFAAAARRGDPLFEQVATIPLEHFRAQEGFAMAAWHCKSLSEAVTSRLQQLTRSSFGAVRMAARQALPSHVLDPVDHAGNNVDPFVLEFESTKGYGGGVLLGYQSDLGEMRPVISLAAQRSGIEAALLEQRVARRAKIQRLEVDGPGVALLHPTRAATREAVSVVLGELENSAYIRLDNFGPMNDPELLSVHYTVRPRGIPLMPVELYGESGLQWIKAAQEAAQSRVLAKIKVKNMTIIGQSQFQRELQWTLPSEEMEFALAADSEDGLFAFAFGARVAGTSLLDLTDEEHPIVENLATHFGQADSNWITINPQVCRALRCRPDPSRRFRWLHEDGEVAFETLFWRDGEISMEPPVPRVVVAKGAVVLASDHAMAALSRSSEALRWRAHVSRSDGKGQSQHGRADAPF